MVGVTVLYPKATDSQFDIEYYPNQHTSLVKERLTPVGLVSVDLEAGLAGGVPDTLPAYAIIARLNVASIEDLCG